mgnify:CR=1
MLEDWYRFATREFCVVVQGVKVAPTGHGCGLVVAVVQFSPHAAVSVGHASSAGGL